MLRYWPEALLWQVCGMLTAVVAFVVLEPLQRHFSGAVLLSAAASHPSTVRLVLEVVDLIYPALVVGLVLPRLVIPALRPGVFIRRAPAQAVA